MGTITSKLPQLVLVSLLIGTTAHAGGGKIHKWVDEKGVTHYGDKMPAKDVHRDNDILNSQGVVVRRNQHRQQESDQESRGDQLRRDRALLASYTSAEEIDLARDRHLQMDEAAIQSLQQRRVGVVKRLEKARNSVESYRQQQNPLPDDLAGEITDIEAELKRIDQQIAAHRRNMESTRARFDSDKRRFIELRTEAARTAGQP
ncbi:MAG TPA: DUF4124 domain-containing protein [Methylophilaceae bacterium]|jgi:chromosome segregation ATPase